MNKPKKGPKVTYGICPVCQGKGGFYTVDAKEPAPCIQERDALKQRCVHDKVEFVDVSGTPWLRCRLCQTPLDVSGGVQGHGKP